MVFLAELADINRIKLSPKLNSTQRNQHGQYLTPAAIARFSSEQFNHFSEDIRLLDPGAGVGMLTAAFVERLLLNPVNITSCFLTAYEIESIFFPQLEQCLNESCLALEKQGIRANYQLFKTSFIDTVEDINLPLFNCHQPKFTHIITNPPYKKIHSQSVERQKLATINIKTTNLYSAFIWLAIKQLEAEGELVAITPRSFCNGTYFRPFRQAFLEEMKFSKIHVFQSRASVFADDKVLQENIIFQAIKTQKTPKTILISNIIDHHLEAVSENRNVDYTEVVKTNDNEQFIYLAGDLLEDTCRKQMERFPASLKELGLEVSTGAVVDFRLKSYLKNEINFQNIPLIYPESVKLNQVIYPPTKPRKPIAIEHNLNTEKWLVKPGWYVLIKRFSAKEEKRRLVAAVCPPFTQTFLGIENHLNYYHAQGEGMDANLARGLTSFLNSSLCDHYFRQFSGHTQVNATDLRKIPYPCADDLIKLGLTVADSVLNQDELDQLIHETLNIMKETRNAIQANKRIQEALTILKEISAPKEQQNERSALCLLALANIQPNTPWNEAQAPLRRITEMMNWFREYYGKEYAPNTRETVRRQTIHQFVQMGLIIENPDQPNRPINSPKWCYQLSDLALELLASYNSKKWQNNLKKYLNFTKNLLKEKQRQLPMIPVSLPNGEVIELSVGGQNELIKDILEQFCPRFTPQGIVLYVGDAGDKFIVNETEKFREIGVSLNPHGKMPDLVIYHQQKDWLVLIEAVTSHGPVNLKRRNELKQLFEESDKGLVFVTAFPSRKEMTRYLAEISWETEVWIGNQPEHLIHFNGERFLGPYG